MSEFFMVLQSYPKNKTAKSLQSCPTLCNPIDGSPPGSPIPGILQARTWSGFPFPSPKHESKKWKWSCSVVSDSSQRHGLQPTWLLHPWDFPGKSTGVGCHCLLQPGWLVKDYFWVYPWRCYWSRLAFVSVDQVKKISEGWHHPVCCGSKQN